jgi:hypothetical protein
MCGFRLPFISCACACRCRAPTHGALSRLSRARAFRLAAGALPSSAAAVEPPPQARASEGGRSSSGSGAAAGAAGASDVRQAALERLAAEHGILNGGVESLHARPPLSAEERAERVLALLSFRGQAADASAQRSRDAAAAAAAASAPVRPRGATPEPMARPPAARRRAWSPAPAHARGAAGASATAAASAAAAAAAAKRPASAPRSRAVAPPPAPAPPVVPAPFALSRCAPDGRHNTAKVAAELAAARAKELTFRPVLNPPTRRASSPFGGGADAPPLDRNEHIRQARRA